MKKTITHIAQSSVLDARLSKLVAQKLGKPYPTMMRELNPFDSNAKLGAETLLDIMLITKNVQALEFMADKLGYKIVPTTQGNIIKDMSN